MKITEMNWMQVEAYLGGDDRAVVPIGSTEQHAGLSLGVDLILSERVSIDAAEPLGVPVFPTLNYGYTPYFTAYPGTVCLRIDTLIALVRDVLDSLRRSGFRRILFVNGHGGNAPAASLIQEWMADNPGTCVRFHNWYNAPKTWKKVQEIDPVAGHASWMENFPWTRVRDVRYPDEQKPMIDIERFRLLDPKRARELLGDGNFGGRYQRADDEMLALWKVAVDETREMIQRAVGVTAGDDPVLIWGAGAIGGTIGAYLARAGHPVALVDIVAEHVDAITERGLAIEGPIEAFVQAAPAFTPDRLHGRYRRALLCVKSHHTAAAVAAMRPFLADDGYVVSAQNGLNERVIAEVVGRERTIGAFVNFGADYLGPGRIIHGGRGAVVVGEIDGRMTPRLAALHDTLRVFEPAAITTDNIWGYLWGKLAYGALLFATALTNDSIADALVLPQYFALYRAIGTEILRVAAAENVRPEGFNGFDPAAFHAGADPAATQRSIDDMVAHNRKSAKSHSGIWRDLAVRKRKTEVDAQIGTAAEIAATHGLRAQLSRCLVRLVHEIEDGKRPIDRTNLDALAEAMP